MSHLRATSSFVFKKSILSPQDTSGKVMDWFPRDEEALSLLAVVSIVKKCIMPQLYNWLTSLTICSNIEPNSNPSGLSNNSLRLIMILNYFFKVFK